MKTFGGDSDTFFSIKTHFIFTQLDQKGDFSNNHDPLDGADSKLFKIIEIITLSGNALMWEKY